MHKIKITHKKKEYECGALITPIEFINNNNIKVEYPVGAIINGKLAQLSKRIPVDAQLRIIQRETYEGQKIYESSLLFLFVTAFRKLFPQLDVFIQHSIQQGIYAEVRQGQVTEKDVKNISKLMDQMVKRDIPINLSQREWDVANHKLKEDGRFDLINLHKYLFSTEIKTYELDGVEDCLYLPLLPSTKCIDHFELRKYQDGIAILMPDFEKGTTIAAFKHNPKLFTTYQEYRDWSRILRVRTVGQLNSYIINSEIGDYMKVSEALHEKKVMEIADQISNNEPLRRVVLIAGPSSSGKTTFSKRLAIQLRVNGFRPLGISLDHYFVDRIKTPKDEFGNYDFESLDAIDYDLFQKHLNELLNGKEIELPNFDFKTGESTNSGVFLKMESDQIIIIEGIHGLNPKLTDHIDDKHKFKIYISALTQLNLHRHDRVPTSDTRLIRRIVRDSLFRGYSANDTLKQWKSVRAGEGKNIFPFQESADVVYNSALFYELSVLKPHAEAQLLKVEPDHPMYAEAQRLLKFLSYFLPLESDDVPQVSILKEFIGGSSFRY